MKIPSFISGVITTLLGDEDKEEIKDLNQGLMNEFVRVHQGN